jgi:hypothetical protein
MYGPYPGKLRMRVIDFVEGGDPDVERPNSSRSPSVLRSGGCSGFVKTGLAKPCAEEEVPRHSRQILAPEPGICISESLSRRPDRLGPRWAT